MMEKFEDLVSNIQEETPATLAIWRISNKNIIDILKEFVADKHDDDDRTYGKFILQTQGLFDRLNPLLAQQERTNDYFSSTLSNMDYPRTDEFSVIFGGKYAIKPHSIPESLVSRLVRDNPRIYTVSRSKPPDDAPPNLTHIQSNVLADDDLGKGEFLKILNMARDEWQKSFWKTTKLVVYFTLGFFRGEITCEKNLTTADNFQEALVESFANLENNSWRVVVTGTDATRPSTFMNDTLDWKMDDTSNSTNELIVPSYKISDRNFVYAMSKLGQYYMVASAVIQLTDKASRTRRRVDLIIRKIEKYVAISQAGGSSFEHLARHSCGPRISLRRSQRGESAVMKRLGNILGFSLFKDTSSLANQSVAMMAKLNAISKNFDDIEKALKNHLLIANCISICYTPLHGIPWTQEAVKSTTNDPRLSIVSQITWRLRNAISIERAISLHFPLPKGPQEELSELDLSTRWSTRC